MKEVYLSREIENVDGYIDEVIDNIRAVPQDEELHMLITCIGGDTFQGDRIYRAILEHGGKTKAIVVGCAISMGASILPAFDSVEIDEGAEIMLHKASINGGKEEYTKDQQRLIDRFNAKTYQRMLDNGVNKELLEKVFLSDSLEDEWLTPKQAESYGLGKVVSISKTENKNQFAVAAKLDLNEIKKERMKFFKKEVLRVQNLADGRSVAFSSKEENIKVGDKLTLVGSDEVLSGKVLLQNNLMAELSEIGLVENIEEVEGPANEMDEERIANIEAQIAELREAVMSLVGEEPSEEEVEAQAKKDEEEEIEAKAKQEEIEAKAKAADDLLKNAVELAETLKSTYKVPSIESKNETVQNQAFEKLTDSEKRAFEMKQLIKEIK